jgi:hypothetical protein
MTYVTTQRTILVIYLPKGAVIPRCRDTMVSCLRASFNVLLKSPLPSQLEQLQPWPPTLITCQPASLPSYLGQEPTNQT